MLSEKQKKMVTGVGLGATTLGTVLLACHHHKEKKKSSRHHQLTKKEFLRDEARGVERERKYLEHVLHLDPIIRRLKRESNPKIIVHYDNGVYCDTKTGKCYVNNIIGHTDHVIVDGYKEVLKHFLDGGYR